MWVVNSRELQHKSVISVAGQMVHRMTTSVAQMRLKLSSLNIISTQFSATKPTNVHNLNSTDELHSTHTCLLFAKSQLRPNALLSFILALYRYLNSYTYITINESIKIAKTYSIGKYKNMFVLKELK